MVGVVMAVEDHSSVDLHKLKPISRRMDEHASLPDDVQRLIDWAWRYYHHPPGEILASATPRHWREGKPLPALDQLCQITAKGAQQLANLAWAQRATGLASLLQQATSPCLVSGLNGSASQRRLLFEREWLEIVEDQPYATEIRPGHKLMREQAQALASLREGHGFRPALIDGVTGSGKTELYLQRIADVLKTGRQVLVLVPEIGLTPQLHTRLQQRFPTLAIAVWTSAHSDAQRYQAWHAAAKGQARLVLGTRSAVFLPFAELGLIVVDEEHDASLKQQDGFRYHARDLAVLRARQADIPILLGSATPSLESLHNAQRGHYQTLQLRHRTATHQHVNSELIDLCGKPLQAGLSAALLNMIKAHIQRGEQVLLFLNRRGYAPILLCHHCGWHGDCPHCDARLTLHRRPSRLLCHHCGFRQSVPQRCPSCHSAELQPVGLGTEQLESVLQERFPEVDIRRFDRDTLRSRRAMTEGFEQVRQDDGKPMILVGTQMLAKGHHWPRLTLVAVVDSDALLFSSDFRASERLAQLMVQLAGRAGRGADPGRVVLQTHQPDHPLWQLLLHGGYPAFARQTLVEREAAGFPPYGYLALLEMDAPKERDVQVFADQAEQVLQGLLPGVAQVLVLGPSPAAMQRRAGRFHYQLALLAEQRKALHTLLGRWLPMLRALPAQHRVHWCLDVDPQQMG
jgi:primosomal protein N' (replication factor Y)